MCNLCHNQSLSHNQPFSNTHPPSTYEKIMKVKSQEDLLF